MHGENLVRVIICPMTSTLHIDELSSQILDRLGKPGIVLSALTAAIGVSVIQRSVSLSPSGLIAKLRVVSYQSVSIALRDCVKQCVINAADGSTQVGLVWAALNQALGNIQQIVSDQIPSPYGTMSIRPW